MDNDFNLASLGNWNQTEVDENFFNDAPEVVEATSAEAVVEAIEKDDDIAEENKEKEKTAEELVDWDDDPNEGAEEVETPFGTPEKKVVPTTSTPESTISAAKLLMDKGIVDFELEEGEDLTEETALELLEEGFAAGVENKLEDLLTELPTELKALNKYVINGGDMNTFLSKMATVGKPSGITSALNISEEKNQELVVKQMYKDEGMDDDFIEAQIESLKDTGKLGVFAKKKFEKWKEQDAKTSENEAKKQEEYAKQQREKARQYYSDLKTIVSKEDFDGIKLSSKDKAELPVYMTERNIHLDNGAVVTPFNQNLMEVLQNQKASIQLAKLLKDRKEDGSFDFSQVEKTATSKVVKEVKDNLRRNKETPRKSIETNSQSRSLADYFK